MMVRLQTFFLIVVLHLMCSFASAQSPCPKDFAQISTRCISSVPIKFTKASIDLNTGLKEDIFFYKAPNNQVGKLKVIGIIKTNKACTLYLDAVTYNGDKIFIPNSSISIGIAKNNWLKERIFLDGEGTAALELIRKKNSCVVEFTQGVLTGRYYNNELEETELWKEKNDLLFMAPLVLIFVAIFLIVRVFMEEQDKFKTQEALEEAENTNKNKNQQIFIKITRPFYKRYFLPLTQGRNKLAIRAKYRQSLANAGLMKDLTPEEFLALKFFMILGGPFAFLAIRWIMEETWPLSITPLMGIVGYFYPDIWVMGLTKKRNDEVLRAMPFIVDMLALSVEAGLDFMAAIQRVIEKAPPSALVEEFETLIKETKIGSSRAEGLRQLGWRVNIIEINSFCATLIAADSVGASIGPILKQLSGELRVKRSARAEQQGATAATKILIPMIFFILPAVLVAIFAPMVLKMMTGKL